MHTVLIVQTIDYRASVSGIFKINFIIIEYRAGALAHRPSTIRKLFWIIRKKRIT